MSGLTMTSDSNSKYIGIGPETPHAWVHWQQEGTQAILGAYRVSSIADVAVGQTKVNYESPMALATNYCCVCSVTFDATHDDDHILNIKEKAASRDTTDTVIVVSLNTNGGSATDFADVNQCSALFFQSVLA